MALRSNPNLDVSVVRFELSDDPARIRYEVRVAGKRFFSHITYHTIPSWRDAWAECSEEITSQLFGILIAWDAMRFLALGGETISLCAGLSLDSNTKELWRECFLKQFSEWRYRNLFHYRSGELPRVVCLASAPITHTESSNTSLPCHSPKLKDRWLITNGGGKDSLVGLLLLNEVQRPYDVYEGYLPTGGSLGMQVSLLEGLRNMAVPLGSNVISVSIEDDFFCQPEAYFRSFGVHAQYFKSDFAVGHTANYPGFFPLIAYHGYSHVWFNIEASADRTMAEWDGETINHQWCKSEDYRRSCSKLYCSLMRTDSFKGFLSTLRGMHDTLIYAIAVSDTHLFSKAHSCNIHKPWCRNCPKCCFSYLMTAAYSSEKVARELIGGGKSLFDMPENAIHWRSLLDPAYVAWECVASHEECVVAAMLCLETGVRHPILEGVALMSKEQGDRALRHYKTVKWSKVEPELRKATFNCIARHCTELQTDVVVIGGGQSGLSMSYTLREIAVNHLVLESHGEGASWLNRWDSFRLNTPNLSLALPGYTYEGGDPAGFSTKHEVIAFLKGYADRFSLPVVSGSTVTSVASGKDGFCVSTDTGQVHCRVVVVATGEYSVPRLPKFIGELPKAVDYLHAKDYRKPTALKPGAVLVVGGGQSGAQIVEDLHDCGRKVFWSISDRPSNVRRLRGKDFMEWWDIGGILHRHVEDIPDVREGRPNALRIARSTEFPLVSGIGGGGLGHSISLQELAESGVQLLGRLKGFTNGTAEFDGRIAEQIQSAITGTVREYDMLTAIAEAYYRTHDLALPDEGGFVPPEVHSGWSLEEGLTEVHLGQESISTIIFATGYRSSWPWLQVPGLFDEFGYPLGRDGVSTKPGLYFLGLFNLQRLSSTCLCNAGRDSAVLASHIRDYLSSMELQTDCPHNHDLKHCV